MVRNQLWPEIRCGELLDAGGESDAQVEFHVARQPDGAEDIYEAVEQSARY